MIQESCSLIVQDNFDHASWIFEHHIKNIEKTLVP